MDEDVFTVAVTGHRPNKLGGYSPQATTRLIEFACDLVSDLCDDYKNLHVITGMAMGWDMAIANACLYCGVPFTAAIPNVWERRTQDEYQRLLRAASKKRVVCEGTYSAYKMQFRNKWMVDNCNLLVALYDGSSGGTGNCVSYAKKKDVQTLNVWDRWQAYLAESSGAMNTSTDT